jgi:hypothetical protein
MTETPDTPEETADETAEETAEGGAAPVRPTTPQVGLQGLLSRESDQAVRPGFRNPSNKRSKAQAKKKGGKKRR